MAIRTTEGRPAWPLDGVRVLDCASFIAGPLAATLLGDLGAEVVKLEPPGGDPMRRVGPAVNEEISATFAFANRGKRSIVLDPGSKDGRARIAALASTATVLVHNRRPAPAEQLGFYEAPIVVEISAFGNDGPYATRPALDPIVQAMSGIVALTGDPGGAPRRAAAPVVDVATSLTAACGALAALREFERGGEPQRLTASLFEVGLLLNGSAIAMQSAHGSELRRLGNASHALLADQFAARDGLVWLAVWETRQWMKLCRLLDLESLGADPLCQTNAGRVTEQERLRTALAAKIVAWEAEELRGRLEEAGIPAALTLSLQQVADDPHVVATGALRTESRLGEKSVSLAAGPLRFGGQRPPQGAPAPGLGEHTDEIVAGLS